MGPRPPWATPRLQLAIPVPFSACPPGLSSSSSLGYEGVRVNQLEGTVAGRSAEGHDSMGTSTADPEPFALDSCGARLRRGALLGGTGCGGAGLWGRSSGGQPTWFLVQTWERAPASGLCQR